MYSKSIWCEFWFIANHDHLPPCCWFYVRLFHQSEVNHDSWRHWSCCISSISSAPFLIMLPGQGSAGLAFLSQAVLGIFLLLWGGPMLAMFVEAFPPEVRVSSFAMAWNVAQAVMGGSSPTIATLMVKSMGPLGPGCLLSFTALIGLLSVWLIMPAPKFPATSVDGYEKATLPMTLACRKKRSIEANDTQLPTSSAAHHERRTYSVHITKACMVAKDGSSEPTKASMQSSRLLRLFPA